MTLLPYRYNQRVGAHPKLAAAGSLSPYFMGRSLLGRLRPIRVDVGGNAPCLAQVFEWPWTEDVAGVPFPVSDIWGLRTRCLAAEEGGEVDWLTAVPRILPEGYTPVGRCGRVDLVADHLGDDPFYGVVHDLGSGLENRPVRWRTPTGQYPPDLEGDGYLWVPMNLNQQTIGFGQSTDEDLGGPTMSGGFSEAANSGTGTGFNGPGCAFSYGFGPNLIRNWVYLSPGRPHIGFRGGKLRIGYFSTNPHPCGVFTVGDVRIVIGYYDGDLSTTALPDHILFDESYTFDDLSNIGPADPWFTRYQIEVDLPSMPVPHADGEPKQWAVWQGGNLAGDGGIVIRECHLSPRVDVPAWFWSSTRNRCAPGGIVLPP